MHFMGPHLRACWLILLFVASTLGEVRPSFTGTWKLANFKDRLRIDRIEHDDPYLSVVSETRDDPTRGTSLQRPLASVIGKHEYRTDGTEYVHKTNALQRWTTVNWQGPALVFLRVVKDGYKVTVTRESWTLSDSGKQLMKAIRIVNMDGVTEETLSFDKE
jgi:hypothetical protein